MSRRVRGPVGRVLRAFVFTAAILAATDAMAKTTGVAEDPAVQSGPCYDALVDKNAATPTTAPNRELGAACEAEHGDIDKAWARVIRLWGSDSVDLPDYDSYRHADAPLDGTIPPWLAWAGLLLTYAALGTPMRSAASLLGARASSASGAVVDVTVSLVLRALIAAAFVALLGLPGLAAVCGIALVLWLALDRWIGPPRTASGSGEIAAGALAVHLAEIINDGLGAATGLAAIALFVQHHAVLFVVALALAVVASAGPIIAARRALRSTRFGSAACRALLAAAIGNVLLVTPPFSAWLGGIAGITIVMPLILAAVTFLPGLRAELPSVSPAR